MCRTIKGFEGSAASEPFTAHTGNGTNSFAAGTVLVATDVPSTVLFDLDNTRLLPGQSVQRCLQVQYRGDVEAGVRFYVVDKADPDGLGAALKLTVEEGAGQAGDRSCGAFSPARTLVVNQSVAAVLDSHVSYDAGVSGWTPSAPQDRSYRFTVSLPADTSDFLQGGVVRATVAVEARTA